MKLTNPFVLLVVIAALVVAVIAWHGNATPDGSADKARLGSASGIPNAASTQADMDNAAVSKAIYEIAARSERWSDAVRLASRTPRIGLAAVVKDMQEQIRSNEDLPFPACLGPGKSAWLESQREVVEGFLGFMENASNPALADHVNAAGRAKRNFDMVLDSCRPPAKAV
jgi:hypothetical protein